MNKTKQYLFTTAYLYQCAFISIKKQLK